MHIEALDPFCSADEARTSMVKPFGCQIRGKWYLCATNGHVAAAIRTDDAAGCIVSGSPPLDMVIKNYGGDSLGACAYQLDALRALPAKWDSRLELRGTGLPLLTADLVKGSGKREKRTKIVDRVQVQCELNFDVAKPVGIDVAYLLQAVDFVGTGAVEVYGSRRDTEAPFFFASGPWLEADRFAVVMPRRV